MQIIAGNDNKGMIKSLARGALPIQLAIARQMGGKEEKAKSINCQSYNPAYTLDKYRL